MSDDETDYRVEFSITRRLPGEDDFTEIGFGSSGAWGDIAQCAHMVVSALQNDEYERVGGQL